MPPESHITSAARRMSYTDLSTIVSPPGASHITSVKLPTHRYLISPLNRPLDPFSGPFSSFPPLHAPKERYMRNSNICLSLSIVVA